MKLINPSHSETGPDAHSPWQRIATRFSARDAMRRRGGQTLVETALVLIVFLLPLTLAIIQFGLVFNATNTMTQIAREGGRYAAIHCLEPTFDSTAVVPNAPNGSPPNPNSGQPLPPATGASASLRYYLFTVANQTGIRWTDIKDRIVVTPVPNVTTMSPTRVPGQPITVTVTYPMANKVFLGSMPLFSNVLGKLDDDYAAKSVFVIERPI